MPDTEFIVRRAAVLGAGVMGAQIAAHLIDARVPTMLFDLPAREGDKNGIVNKAIEGLKKLQPSPLAGGETAAFIQPANYDEHLPLLGECDLVIEAIAERLDWKMDLYHRVAPHLGPRAILASNTSGLSIARLAEACPRELRPRFCGVHFFNPPRYMHLAEIIPCGQTLPAVLDDLERFLVTALGKGVIRAKDTPNFVANRVGVFSMLATIANATRLGIRFDVVDDLTGPRLGRPKSATFRTADVVGLDTFAHVVKTMQEGLPQDPWRELFRCPPWLDRLIEAGALGAKTRGGIYRKKGDDLRVLDPSSGEYVTAGAKADPSVTAILKLEDPAQKLERLRASEHPEAQFLWACLRDTFHYIAYHLEDIAHCARDVDLAMRWGFGWKAGPFETWQAAGWPQVAAWIEQDIAAGKALAGVPLPAWAREPGRQGVHFPQGSYDAGSGTLIARSRLAVYRRQLFAALVIWQTEAPFSVGANLESLRPALASGDWRTIEGVIALFQKTSMRLRYSRIPTVAATQGYVFGGGCEFAMHCDRVVAALESYVGLVEAGVGLLPAGGGCKELARRAAQESKGDLLASLKDYYMMVATAKVAGSAIEARESGHLRSSDLVVLNSGELLHIAKQQALALHEAAYRPPLPGGRFAVAGRSGAASIKGQLVNMLEGHFISEYDFEIGSRIAEVMTGGDLEPGTEVSEDWILALELRHFLALLKNPKTQERIVHTLTTGKPLRN
jgi:3-hydroxyacyl-CoA dehydrogenase